MNYNVRTVRLLPALLFVTLIIFSGCQKSKKQGTHFKLLSPEKTGIDFNNALTETHEMNVISYPDFYSGGGVSIGDIDNDGLSDVFFTGNQVPARLYKNLGGLRFKDITEAAKLGKMGRGWYTGTCMVDINADGFLDMYISKSGMEAPEDRANLLFVNNQDGTFTERAREYGLDNKGFGVNAVFFDYDKDGDLDAYISNQVTTRVRSSEAERMRKVNDPYAGDKLYENLGNTFIDVTEQAGLYSSELGFAHGAAVGDINNDGWEDFFVSNDFFEYDYLYLNNGDKTFTESIKEATKHISLFSMGNDMADFNNDGLLDIMVLDMVAEDNRRMYANTGGLTEQRFAMSVHYGLHHQYMFNVLHLNNGNATFSEVGMLAGISRTDWSWAPLFADFDNDGLKDLFISNGLRKDIRNIDWGNTYRNMTRFVKSYNEFEPSQWDFLLNSLPSEQVQNYMFRNNGDLTFTKVMDDWGFKHKSWSNGAAYGDLDNDGDLDLVVNNVDDVAFIYENGKKDGSFIQFIFKGSEKNPMGLGTKVSIYHGNKFQYQQHYISRGYRSSMQPLMHFGLDKDTLIQKVEVIWVDGKSSVLEQVAANQVITLDYAESKSSTQIGQSIAETYFEDVTERLGVKIRHRENEMNDFMSEPMLPYKLSTFGPAFAIADVNGDGLDDLFIGGGFRYAGQLYIQNEDGRFTASQEEFWNRDRYFEDIGAAFFDVDNDGDRDLYVASGGNEHTLDSEFLVDRLYLNDGNGVFTKTLGRIPEIKQSGGVVKPADIDKDGDLDVFVGGRLVPRKYPMPADSYLYMNNGGKFENATPDLIPELAGLGLVTDATWSDADSDGDLDLFVVGEFMPITIFINDSGRFTKQDNNSNGLEKTSGWWWSITSADMDRDGDDDYVVGNMGLNYKYKPADGYPLELFAGNFDRDDKLDFVFGHYQKGKLYPFNDRRKAILQNQSLADRISTNQQYAISTLYDIYGKETLDSAYNLKIYTLHSGYVENLGDGKFDFRPFNNYAQLSNVNSILIRDIDGDNNQDLMLAGNLMSMEAETIRNDAGIGMFMKGDGQGNFMPIPYPESGLFIDGDVRALKEVVAKNNTILLAAKNNDFVQAIRIAMHR